MFKRGDDPRRAGGRMRLYDGLTLSELARMRTPKALALLDRAMADEACPWPVRVRAAEILFERGHGKPLSVIDMQVTAKRDVTALPMDELLARATAALRTPITIDGEASEPALTATHTADSAHGVVS